MLVSVLPEQLCQVGNVHAGDMPCNTPIHFAVAMSDEVPDALYNMGLVHGVSRRATRPLLCGTAVFLDVLLVGILIYWVLKALPYVG